MKESTTSKTSHTELQAVSRKSSTLNSPIVYPFLTPKPPVRPWVENPSMSEVILLSEDTSKERFSKAIKNAGGNAFVVVHPLYHEANYGSEDTLIYPRYKEQLQKEVEKSSDAGIPLVVLETSDDFGRLPDTLARMGKLDGEVFVIETKAESPEPKESSHSLEGVSKSLHEEGLRHATVSGSYLWLNKIQEDTQNSERLQGCVGYTINTFSKNGIEVTIGEAAYPRSSRSIRRRSRRFDG